MQFLPDRVSKDPKTAFVIWFAVGAEILVLLVSALIRKPQGLNLFLGIIGFVGIICPHAVKRLIGHDHRWALPASALCGSVLLLAADALSRSLGSGSALPVGAITSLLGAPFFLALIFGRKESRVC